MRFSSCVCLVMLAACGEVNGNGHLADAPVEVDAPDAMEAPTTGVVHVTVLDSGGAGTPAVGAKVVFVNPDGTIVKETATDGAGKAEAEIMTGASVTSVQINGDETFLHTTLAIVPGDNLILGNTFNAFVSPTQMTIAWTPYTGTFSQYQVAGPCGTTSVIASAASVAMNFYPFCTHATNEIVVSAMTANGEVLVSTHKAGVVPVAGTTLTMPSVWAEGRTFTAAYTNIDPMVSNLQMMRVVPDGFGTQTQQSVTRPATTATLTTTGAIGATALIRTIATSNTLGVQQTVLQAVGGGAASYGLDIGGTLLPWVRKPTFDGAHTIHATNDTTGTSNARPDVFRVESNYRHTDAATGATSFISWTIFGPGFGDVTVPALPASLAHLMPAATDALHLEGTALEVEVVDGYGTARLDPAGMFTRYLSSAYSGGMVRQSSSPPQNTFR